MKICRPFTRKETSFQHLKITFHVRIESSQIHKAMLPIRLPTNVCDIISFTDDGRESY